MIMQLSDVDLGKAILDAAIAENAAFHALLPRFRSNAFNAQVRVTAALQHRRFEAVLIDGVCANLGDAKARRRALEAEQEQRAAAGRPPVAVHFEPEVAARTIAATQTVTDETLIEMERLRAAAVLPTPANDAW
jgi:hypothetical protein